MKTGFLFAGQGQQFLGMGQDLAEKFSLAKEHYQKAENILGVDLLSLNQEQLNQTVYTQPALFVQGTILWKLLKEKGIEATVVLGLSLGEYTALGCAEVFDFETGLKLIQVRAGLMQDAFEPGETGMAACLKTERKLVEQALEGTNLAICNVNTHSQFVIGGSKEDLTSFLPELKQKGIRALPLNVSSVSHMHLLEATADLYRQTLETVGFETPACTFINNLKAEVQTEGFVDSLSRHLCEKTELALGIERMHELGVERFIEIGPKGTLSKFVRELLGDEVEVLNVYDLDSLEALNG